jgi:hypothetical protein
MFFRVFLKIKVVQVAGEEPEFGVFAKVPGITFHGGRHHTRVVALVVVFDVVFEQDLRGGAGRQRHGFVVWLEDGRKLGKFC